MTDSIRVPHGDELTDGEVAALRPTVTDYPRGQVLRSEDAARLIGRLLATLDAATARALAAEEALRDGAIPAMRFAAARLSALGDDSTATDLRADADKIAAANRTASGDEG